MALSQNLKDYESIIVYHGSHTVVWTPDFGMLKDGKDFGKGFYTTSSKRQAENFARIVTARETGRTPMLNAYRLSSLDGLNVKVFAETEPPTPDWLGMIIDCRKKKLSHGYDVVIGPVADDKTSTVIQVFLEGLYGPPESLEAQEFAIKQFMSQRLSNQIVFCSEKAATRLTFIDVQGVAERRR